MFGWNTTGFVYLLCAGLVAVYFAFMLQSYRKLRFRAYAWLALVWAVVAVTFVLIALGEFLRNPLVGRISWFTLLPVGFLWMLAFDTMTRDAYEPVKLVVMAVLSSAVIFTSVLVPDSTILYTIYGEPYYMIGGVFAVACFSWMATNKAFQTYFLLKIYRHIPRSMRGTSSRLWLAAAIMAGLGLFVVYGFQLANYVPGAPALDVALAGALALIALVKEPRIAFVVPFKAYRLMVIETTGGLPLFTHNWGGGERFPDEDLFSGLIQGLNLLAKQSLKKGDVEEMRLSEAVLTVKRSEKFPVACVLIADQASRTLRDQLKTFAERFFTQFAGGFETMHDIQQFSPAIKLVQECFPFVISRN